MQGGDLHWIWKPYEIYQEVRRRTKPSVQMLIVLQIDWVYGVRALEDGDGASPPLYPLAPP